MEIETRFGLRKEKKKIGNTQHAKGEQKPILTAGAAAAAAAAAATAAAAAAGDAAAAAAKETRKSETPSMQRENKNQSQALGTDIFIP